MDVLGMKLGVVSTVGEPTRKLAVLVFPEWRNGTFKCVSVKLGAVSWAGCMFRSSGHPSPASPWIISLLESHEGWF